MLIPRSKLNKPLLALLDGEARRATYYVSPDFVVKATRRHKCNKRATRQEVLVTFGAPNYAERQFIRAAKKAGETFPVKKVQLKWWPAK